MFKRSVSKKLVLNKSTIKSLDSQTVLARGGGLHVMKDDTCANACGTTTDDTLCETACPGRCSGCGF